jgi:hypothetical protein
MNKLSQKLRMGGFALPHPNPLPQAGEGTNATLCVFRIFCK